MNKLLQYAFLASFLVAFAPAHGQEFEIEPETSSTSVHPSAWDGVAYSLVINTGSATTEYVWEREIVSITPEWNIAVCDKYQCHDWATETEEFTMSPGEEGTLDVHAYPMSTPGSAVVLVHVWEVDNPETVVTGTYYFNTAVGVSERLTEAISVYPNPAEDLIFIGQGAEDKVARIELFSLTGKRVMGERLMSNNSVEVSSLPTGTYIARLYDEDDVQLSSNVVVKK